MPKQKNNIWRDALRSYSDLQKLVKILFKNPTKENTLLAVSLKQLQIIQNVYINQCVSAQKYIQYRYFEHNECTFSEYAEKFGCEERTVQRWDAHIKKILMANIQIFFQE